MARFLVNVNFMCVYVAVTVSQHFLRVNTTQNNRKQWVFAGFYGVTHKNFLMEHTKTHTN